jgi:hypothetical protein
LSLPSSSHAYGIGLIAVIIGAAVGVSYYQLYFVPEFNAKPIIPDKVLHLELKTNNRNRILYQKRSMFNLELII